VETVKNALKHFGGKTLWVIALLVVVAVYLLASSSEDAKRAVAKTQANAVSQP
jgi:hypothetical protein